MKMRNVIKKHKIILQNKISFSLNKTKAQFLISSLIIFLLLTLFLTLPVFSALAENENTYAEQDRIYISKTGELWDNYVNMMNIVFQGGKVNGLYYHKLYAEYDSEKGGFVIKNKVPSHVSYSKEVGSSSFGLCFSYNPEYEQGNSFGRQNYSVWSKLRVGDVLYPHGIDFTKKTIQTEGSLKEENLKTDAYFTVSYETRKDEPTSYSNKTIVAFGDSVTCNGGWTETVSDMIGCEVINAGVSADRVTEGLKRLDKDVLKYSPDIVLVMFGINDCVQYYYSEKTVINFKNELTTLYEKCKKAGAEVVFITPNNIKLKSLNFDRYKNYGGISKCYPLFINAIKEVAMLTDSYCIDVYSRFENAEELLCDTVHPNAEGYEIISGAVADFLITYEDRICGEEIGGYVSAGVGNFEIKEENIFLPSENISTLKTYFCTEVAFFENGIIMNDSDQINDNCTVCWIDKKGNKNDELKVIIKE